MSDGEKGPLKKVLDFFLAGPDAKNASDSSEGDNSTTSRGQGKGKRQKPSKPKSAAQLRKERNDAKRRATNTVRYGGDRKYIFIGFAAICAIALLSPIALMTASSKVGDKEVRSIVEEQMKAGGRDFPTGQSVMWAGQVLRVWGTWDEETKDSREVSMAPYLSSGMDSQAGWDGRGKQEITYASVNPEPQVLDANHAAVDAVYQIGDGSWRCVTIPVYAYKPDSFDTNAKWAFALSGNPTPTACAPRTGAPTAEDDAESGKEGREQDEDLGNSLAKSFFPGFFSAWAGSDSDALKQYTASGVKTTGLGGAMTSNPQPGIGDVAIWIDDGKVKDGVVYNAVVPVTWTVDGSKSRISAEYIVPMKKDGEQWFVAGEPRPSQQATDVQGGDPQSIPEPGDDVTEGTYPSSQETETPPPEESKPNDSEPASEPPEDGGK